MGSNKVNRGQRIKQGQMEPDGAKPAEPSGAKHGQTEPNMNNWAKRGPFLSVIASWLFLIQSLIPVHNPLPFTNYPFSIFHYTFAIIPYSYPLSLSLISYLLSLIPYPILYTHLLSFIPLPLNLIPYSFSFIKMNIPYPISLILYPLSLNPIHYPLFFTMYPLSLIANLLSPIPIPYLSSYLHLWNTLVFP